VFETESDVLTWYEGQPRALTEDFVNSIPWHEVRAHPLDPAFVPVLVYMRDVEAFTDIYYAELRRTPTGKSPVIKKFMDRWSVEEFQHAELLNRFLNEAGIPTSADWFAEARAAIPFNYTFENRLYPLVTNCFGTNFSAVHMTWGAINEMTTLQGYRRLWQLAKHPVLEKLLRAIAQEEAAHSKFYWNIARLKLERSGFARRLATTVISKFWTPVGQGTKPKQETNYLIATLFKGADGVDFFDRNVNEKLEQLPGFDGNKTVTQRIARIAL
jgi:ferritin-like protein